MGRRHQWSGADKYRQRVDFDEAEGQRVASEAEDVVPERARERAEEEEDVARERAEEEEDQSWGKWGKCWKCWKEKDQPKHPEDMRDWWLDKARAGPSWASVAASSDQSWAATAWSSNQSSWGADQSQGWRQWPDPESQAVLPKQMPAAPKLKFASPLPSSEVQGRRRVEATIDVD